MNEIINSIKKTKLKKFYRPNPRKDYPPTYRPMHQNNKLSNKLENKATVLLQGKNTNKSRIKIYENPEILSDHFEDLITQLNCIDYSKSLYKLKNKHKEGNFLKSNRSNSKSEPLQHDASTSREMGTMTDSLLSRKLKENSGSEESSIVLQSISVNKSEGRALLGILSKSSLDVPPKLGKYKEKKLPVNVKSTVAFKNSEDYHIADKESVCHQKFDGDSIISNMICDTSEEGDVSNILTKEYFSGFEGDSEEIRQHIGTPDFKGFSNACTPDFSKVDIHNCTSDLNVDRIDKKKLRNNYAPTDLDHPYSYCTLDPNSNTTSVQVKSPVKDFPNFPFMSRSVFGSPSSSKNPPDILLHNDKINILRQMSHVFNDESSKANIENSKAIHEIIPNDRTKETHNNGKLVKVDLNCSKAMKMLNTFDSKANKVTNSENKVILDKENLLDNTVSEIVPDKPILNLVMNDDRNEVCLTENELNSSSPLYDTDDKTVPVYLVSSHSLDKEESIKVKSYVGQRGEHVDIIDGFAFASFNNLCEINSYKNKRVLKRKKKKRFSKIIPKVIEREYKSSGITKGLKNEFVSSVSNEKISCETPSVNLLDPNMHCNTSLENGIELCKMKEATIKDDRNLSGAFASNDLDKYLNSNSNLNISFSPSIRSTSTRTDTSEINKNNFVEWHQLQNTGKDIVTDTVNKLENCVSSVSEADKANELRPSSNVASKINTEVKDQPVEIIYVYHSGRLLTLAGSLTKVNPSTPQNVKARVALPRGHQSLIEHSHKVLARKVKVVEINEDMAKFALSALKAPFKIDVEPSFNSAGNQKVTKENILDILTAKLAIDKNCDLELEKSQSKNVEEAGLGLHPDKIGSLGLKSRNVNNCEKIYSTPSKVKWNQDDILKKSLVSHTTEQSMALNKNIKRFPSLSREMKRLNMNYIQCKNKVSSMSKRHF